MSTMTGFDYVAALNMSQGEIQEKMKTDRSFRDSIPVRGQDYAKFVEFARSEPGSDERKKIIADISGNPVPEPTQDPVSEIPEATPEKREPEKKDDVREAYEKARELIRKQEYELQKAREQIDRTNAERGQIGEKLKRLEEEFASFKNAPKETPPVVAPVEDISLPNPEDYDDGTVDPKYEEDQRKFYSALAEKNKRLEKELAEIKAHVSTLDDIKKKASDAYQYVETVQRSNAQSEYDRAWDALWSDAKDFQKRYGLDTSIPIDEIDTYVSSGNKEKIETLPKSDVDRYRAVTKIVREAYDITGTPKRKFRNMDAAIYNLGLQNEYRPVSDASQHKNQIANNLLNGDSEYVSAPSASSHTNANPTPPATLDGVEKSDRFKYLLDLYRTAVAQNAKGRRDPLKAFQATHYDEFRKLGAEMGYKVF